MYTESPTAVVGMRGSGMGLRVEGSPGAWGRQHCNQRGGREELGRGQKGAGSPRSRSGKQWGNEGGKSAGTRGPHGRRGGCAAPHIHSPTHRCLLEPTQMWDAVGLGNPHVVQRAQGG